MRRLMNYLRGMVRIRAEGPFPERLMNLCAQEGVEFWQVSWLNGRIIRMTVRRRAMGRLEALAERANCVFTVEESRGLPDLLLRFRARYAFLLGLALSLCAVLLLSRFVLTVQVTGNEKVPTAVILNQLRQLGVRPGVYGPAVDRKQLAQELQARIKELSWAGINLHGTRLEVIVRETIPAPERLDESGCWDIIAEADGLILKVEPEQGDARVQKGDTVLAGDVLISGVVTMEPPIYSDLPERYYESHARGRVWARTWRTLTASIPVAARVKNYTGEERTVWSLEFPGSRIEIFGNSRISWPFYDKIVTVRKNSLPIWLRRERYRAYEFRTAPVDLETAQALLEHQLRLRLEELTGPDGAVERLHTAARVEGGLLRVTAEAECREEIGREVPAAGLPVPEQRSTA